MTSSSWLKAGCSASPQAGVSPPRGATRGRPWERWWGGSLSPLQVVRGVSLRGDNPWLDGLSCAGAWFCVEGSESNGTPFVLVGDARTSTWLSIKGLALAPLHRVRARSSRSDQPKCLQSLHALRPPHIRDARQRRGQGQGDPTLNITRPTWDQRSIVS